MLSKLTGRSRKTLKENPHRINEVNKQVESMGASWWPRTPSWVLTIS